MRHISSFLVYQYHDICRNSSPSPGPLCFFDDQYLCFCEANNYRAECFDYDHKLDHCNWCYSNGRCVRGDLEKSDDFLCLCQKCYYGHRCQYSSERFSFTLEQLFTHDLLSSKGATSEVTFYITIIGVCFFFIFGALNNLFTFVTFHRSKFLRTGVGNYLLVGSVVNQITLLFLALRLIHIVLNTIGRMTSVNASISHFLCKFLVYALTSSGQLSYWLMSTVAIERLYITWNIKGTWLIKPYIARRIVFILTIVILLINAPQIVFYSSLLDPQTNTKSIMCIVIYPHHFWTYFNQANNYINTLLPLIINMICTVGIMFLIARQKLLANKKSSK
jgi:hypothetical protein